jgi:hypothetical protein
MKASEFDQLFDDSESVIGTLELASARKPNLEQRKVNVDFPIWMIEALDRTARSDAPVGHQDVAGRTA